MSDTLSNTQISIEATALRYFTDHAHPETGLIRDQVHNFTDTPDDNDRASMAATGFGLAVLANAASRGMVNPRMARERILKALRFSEKNVPRYKGWFGHFANWQTGAAPNDDNEYSTIDTALFLAGALYAGAVLETGEIQEIAQRLLDEVDFLEMLTDGGQQPQKNTLTMSYSDKDGFDKKQWDMYGEQMMLLFMGLGHAHRPLPPEVWLGWRRRSQNLLAPASIFGMDQALFVHQYSHCFVDFRQFRDTFRIDYFDNSKKVSRYHRQLMQNSVASKTLHAGFWGFSAGDAPNNKYCVFNALDRIGTVCVGAALGSAMFMPEEVLHDAARWKAGPHGDKVWGRYGFCDSLDLDRDWISQVVMGITKGPEFLSLANVREHTSVWRTFMSIPEVVRGMERAAAAGAPKLSVDDEIGAQLDDEELLA